MPNTYNAIGTANNDDTLNQFGNTNPKLANQASAISFDNSGTGMSATNVQSGLEELNSKIPVTINPKNGYQIDSNDLVIINGMLFGSVSGGIISGSLTPNTWNTIASSELRPSKALIASAICSDGTFLGQMVIGTDGDITMMPKISGAVGGLATFANKL